MRESCRFTQKGRRITAQANTRQSLHGGHCLTTVGGSDAVQGLAVLYFRYLGPLDEAAVFAHRATQLIPKVSGNYALLANILWNLGDYETAEVWSAHAARLAPDGFDTRTVQVSILAAKGEWQAAASISQPMLERFPRAGLFAWAVSTHHMNEGNLEQALAAFTSGFPG